MKKLYLTALIVIELANAQTPNDVRNEWLSRGGVYRDNIQNESSIAFAMLESGRIDSSWLNTYVVNLSNNESLYSGNRGVGPIMTQLVLWYGDKLPVAAKNLAWKTAITVAGDDYYNAQAWNNGQINCMLVRALMGRFLRGKTVLYDYIPQSGNADFVFEGREYKRGGRYDIEKLGSDWLQAWGLKYVDAQYLHGELFSEVYGLHFFNAFITLADSRSGVNAEIKRRAAMVADFMFAEHGAVFNGHHVAGPLGRTYLYSNLYGGDFFFPWAPFFGMAWPTHYGCSGSFFATHYQLPKWISDFRPLPRTIYSRAQGYRYVIVTDRYTLGCSPRSGDWILELNSDDSGPFPESRPGFNFRLWMNQQKDDLDMGRCDGECYADMGQGGFQYRDALFIPRSGLYLHEILANNRWNKIEFDGGWRFAEENGIGVATRIEAYGGALEVSRLGVDEANFETFKAAVLGRSKLNGNTYTTRRGDKLVANESTFYLTVNNEPFNLDVPRLSVVDRQGQELIATVESRKFRIGGVNYDFNTWTIGGKSNLLPPSPPKGLKIN